MLMLANKSFLRIFSILLLVFSFTLTSGAPFAGTASMAYAEEETAEMSIEEDMEGATRELSEEEKEEIRENAREVEELAKTVREIKHLKDISSAQNTVSSASQANKIRQVSKLTAPRVS